MLLSPKWQTMWMESQFCSKTALNSSLPSQQAKKILEDLRTSCCSPNKTIQLEALKCWGTWINNHNPDDWKLNTVCYTAVRPLLTKKLQPLHKDVDVCKLKLSLMWALLVKVQNIMQLEGPQYILEVFLQSCLTWLSSTGGDGIDNEVSLLIFQLILAIFKKDENLVVCDREMFPSLSTEIFQLKKVFHHLADKFLNVFVYWRKLKDKSLILKIWNHFLEHCAHSCEYIPIPVWHKVFKLAGQICAEKSEPIKDRLAFLHGSAIKLKSVLLSSKFIDYGNLLTTPCEALLKKLVELSTIDCEEFFDGDMFMHSQEICKVLTEEGTSVGGYDLCIFVLDALEEFALKSLYWGVWCGLVQCYKIQLMGVDKNDYTKLQMKFYRKLRGVAVNFDLDKKYLHKDCVQEIQKHISVLNITCLSSTTVDDGVKSDECGDNGEEIELESFSQEIVPVVRKHPFGEFAFRDYAKTIARKTPRKTISFKFDLIKDIFKRLDGDTMKSLLTGLFNIRFLTPNVSQKNISLQLTVDCVRDINLTVSCVKEKATPVKMKEIVPYKAPQPNTTEEEDETPSTPKTRSRSRAEKESKKETESQKRKKRRSFEVLVQEIVQKNRLRKTEKNSTRKKSPVALSRKEKRNKTKEENSPVIERKLRKTKKEDGKSAKTEEKKSPKNKTDGKLENYFKVITKKTGNETQKQEISNKQTKGKKKKKKEKETVCCNAEEETERKGEIAWRQTSLKTMMKRNKKEKAKQGTRTKSKNGGEEKPKPKTEKKLMDGKAIAQLSPFKEVFHDHEYTKIELPDIVALERVLSDNNREKVKGKVEKKATTEEKMEIVMEDAEESPISQEEPIKLSEIVAEQAQEEQKTDVEEFSETNGNLEKRGKKRIRILDSLKPSKKIKLDLEEEVEDTMEVIEKENLETLPEEKKMEFVSPTKEGEKTSHCPSGNWSPKMINGSISSRALRMIALLPESTKSGQLHRETQPKVEISKFKKAPNVDKNSRASKMLALLSENSVRDDPEELNQTKDEEMNSIATTPLSTLKSPKSVKKRKSIRFDDAKNETVLYQIDTPPSQILEEKEKCRRNKIAEVIVAFS